MARLLLKLGVLVPLIYLGAILGAAWFYPAYNPMTQAFAILGGHASPHREVFNDGMMAAGGVAVLAAFGFFLALHRLSRGFIFAILTTVAIGLWGIATLMSGYYPLPDMRHDAYGLWLALQAAPLLAMLALMRDSKLAWLKALSMLLFVASGALLAVLMGAGALVHLPQLAIPTEQAGLWRAVYAAILVPWIALAAMGLHAAMSKADRRTAIKAKLAMD